MGIKAGVVITLNPKFSLSSILGVFLGFLTFACGSLPPAYSQTTTYSYRGNPLAPYPAGSLGCTGCTVTGSFTLSGPLGANLGTNFPFCCRVPGLVSFSFSAGPVTITNLNASTTYIAVATDGNGLIKAWDVRLYSPGAFGPFTNRIGTGNGPPGSGSRDSVAYSADSCVVPSLGYNACQSLNDGPPGTWVASSTSTSCPAPTAVFPFAGGNKSADGLPTAMLATFSPSTSGASLTLTEAANECNVMGFDWQQTVNNLPIPFADAYGTPLSAPFSDPPSAGYTYMFEDPVLYARFLPPSQTFPFYYNPTLVSSECAISNIGGCTLPITSGNGQTLNFFDSPQSVRLPAGGYFGFTTSLVGVLPGNAVGQTFFTWSWKSTYNTVTGGVKDVRTASSLPVDGSGTGGVTITSINGIPQTPPIVTCAATPNTLWPPNGKSVSVTISGNITAGTSVLTATTYTVGDEYGQVQPGGNMTLGAAGSYSFGVPLIAARNGDDLDGRTYTIIVRGSDALGNVGSCSAVVTVPHDSEPIK